MVKKLYKSRTDRKLEGVCGGLAQYLNMDPTVIRLAWVIFVFMGWGILAYIVCAIFVPLEPENPVVIPNDEVPRN